MLTFFLFLCLIRLSVYLSILTYINDETELFWIRGFVTFQYKSDQMRRQIEKIWSLLDSIVVFQTTILSNYIY